ncbi:MAG: hypothetical protein JNN20_10425 [Betaproteobacteria bacterium]|nr:hypothetical protein [Betaproteobacteria bacterium]
MVVIEQQPLTVSAFPKDRNAWRIDWLGEAAFPDRTTRRRQPSVLVYLSRVIADNYQNDPSVLLKPWSTSEIQRSCWVSVGTLVILRVGDIWRNQQLELRPDYELETFDAVQIGATTTRIVKAGHSQHDGEFLLPLDNHPWHRSNTHSFCVVVALTGGRQLVVPCCELIRFYFGSSSGLLSRLFLPPLDRRSLYTQAEFDRPSGRLFLELAQYISGASAADIGRLHLDPVAWRAALRVGSSMLKASVARQRVYPQTFFPFVGKTTLAASGKWLPAGDRPDATFIVYNLRSCSHVFPFRSLRYEMRGGRPISSEQSGADRSNVAARRSPKDSSNQKLVERDASNNLATATRKFQYLPRFPDLLKKTVLRRRTLPDECGPAISLDGAPNVKEVAVGEPGSARRIRPVDLAGMQGVDEERPWPVPAFLRDAVKDLARLKGLVEIELLTPSEEDGWTVTIPAVMDGNGVADLALFVEDDHGAGRLRRAAVFALRHDQEHASLVLIEDMPVHARLYATAGLDSEEVGRSLNSAVADFISGREPLTETIADEIRWVFDLDN